MVVIKEEVKNMKKSMMNVTVWRNGEFVEISDETEFYVGRCGSGRTVFGESAKLHKILNNHLVFITKSGSFVKTDMNMNTVGKASKENYWVCIGDRTNNPEYINERVHYWNEKKLCIEYK